MSITVAEGVIAVTADMGPAASQIARSGNEIGARAGGGFLTSGLGLGKKLVGGLALSAGAAVVTGVGALAGTALTRGFSRALNIQDAQAKLMGLGHSANEVTGIMKDALASVKGTAFGLDEAATVSAGAVAAGIKPGQDLQRVLKLTADTATITGRSLGDMGSIFNQVAASGKLQGDVIAQLQDAGVPVLQFVAKQMHTTAAGAAQMASDGKVSFADFEAAMQAGLGGAALKSGNTARGALANVGAALGRLGAQFATPIVAALPGVFNSLSGAIDAVGAKLSPFAAAFGSMVGPALASAAKWIGDLIATVPGAVGPFAQLASVLSPVHLIFAAIQPVLPGLVTAFSTLGSSLGTMASSLASAILPVFNQLVSLLSGVLVAVMPTVVSFVSSLASTLATLAPVVTSVISAILPLVTTLVSSLAPIITQLVTTILPPVAQIFSQIVAAVAPLVSAIMSVLIPVIQALLPVVMTVFNALLPIIQPALQIILGVVQVVTGILTGNWSQAWSGIKNIVSGAWGVIKGVVVGAINIVKAVIVGNITATMSIWSAIWSRIGGTVSTVVGRIGGFVGGLVSTISGKIGQVVSFFAGLPGRIIGAVAGLESQMISVGANIVLGMVSGIRNKIGSVVSAITGVASGAINQAKAILGIKSPSRVFMQLGRYVVQGFTAGISAGKSSSDIQKTMTSMANKITDAFNTKVNTKVLVRAATATSKAVYRTVTTRLISSAQEASAKGALSRANKTLKTFADERVIVVDRLKKANTNLADLLKQSADYKASVVKDITSGVDPTQQQNAADYMQSLRDQVTQTKTLTSVLSRLKKAGLDSATYSTLASKGLDALPIAQSILDSGKSGIKGIATLQGQLSSAANTLGSTTSNSLYGAGIQAAQGIVDGLKSQQSAIDKSMASVGKSLVKSIKKALGIKSPSRVMADEVGPYLVSGIGVGALAGLPALGMSLSSGISGMVQQVAGSMPAIGGDLGSMVTSTGSAGSAGGSSSSDARGAEIVNNDNKIVVYEAEDPLGTVGRVRSELRKWSNK